MVHLLADFLMIFILLRSLNPPGEQGGRGGETTAATPPFTALLLFSAVQWKADLRRATAAPAGAAPEVPCPPAFQRYRLLSDGLVAFFILADGEKDAFSFLVASPLSRAL